MEHKSTWDLQSTDITSMLNTSILSFVKQRFKSCQKGHLVEFAATLWYNSRNSTINY